MTTSDLYATSHITGTVSTPGNALGVPDTVLWTTDTDNASWDSRFAMDNIPAGQILDGTQTVTVRVRKETGTGTPSLTVELWENGAFVLALNTSVGITSLTGQNVVGTFADTDITDPSAVEIRLVGTASGGSPSARTTPQIDGITWTATYVAASVNAAAEVAASTGTAHNASITVLANGGEASASGAAQTPGTGRTAILAAAVTNPYVFTGPLGGLSLPGLSGNYASTPDPVTDIAEDFEIEADFSPSDWTPGADNVVLSKQGTPGVSTSGYSLRLATDGTMVLSLGVTVGGVGVAISAASPVVALNAHEGLRVKVTFDMDDGAGNWVATFYTDTGSGWVAFGSPIVTAQVVTAVRTNTTAIQIGGTFSGTSLLFNGVIRQVVVRDGIGGTDHLDLDFEDRTQGWEVGDSDTATGTDGTGKTVTINGSLSLVLGPEHVALAPNALVSAATGSAHNASISVLANGAEASATGTAQTPIFGRTPVIAVGSSAAGLYLPGSNTNSMANSPAHVDLELVGVDVEVETWMLVLGRNAAGTHALFGKWNPLSLNTGGWFFVIDSNGHLRFQWGEGAASENCITTVPLLSVVDLGRRFGLKFTLDIDNGSSQAVGTYYYDLGEGGGWQQLGDVITNGTTAAIATATNSFRIGADIFGNNNSHRTIVESVTIRHGISGTAVFDVHFDDASRFLPGAPPASGTDATGKSVAFSSAVVLNNATVHPTLSTTGTESAASGAAQQPGISITFGVGSAAASGSAHDATVITSKVVDAAVATAIGTADNVAASVAVGAVAASATGTAQQPNVDLDTNAIVATATSTADNATISTNDPAEALAAAATGSAAQPSVALLVNALVATAAGTSHDADGAPSKTASAEAAISTGVAQQPTTVVQPVPVGAAASGTAFGVAPTVFVNALVASAAGSAHDATVSTASNVNATATVAEATGAAGASVALVGPNAEVATGVGVAHDPGISTIDDVSAGLAEATGAAQSPSPLVAPNAAGASAAGTGHDAAVSTNDPVEPTVATATGTAFDATVSTSAGTSVNAEVATATGAVDNAATIIAVGVIVATASVSGHNATASTSASTTASAEVASSVGTAHGPAASIATLALLAEAVGVAQPVAASLLVNSTVALGTGTSHDATGLTAIFASAEVALSTGSAFDLATLIAPTAGSAAATGTASNASVPPQFEVVITWGSLTRTPRTGSMSTTSPSLAQSRTAHTLRLERTPTTDGFED